MTDGRDLDALLEPFFAAAREAPPELSPAAMRAILDAAAPRRTVRVLWGRELWGALGGMAAAAAVGLWLGFVGSEQVMRLTVGSAEETVSVLDESDILALAGE
ncbi:hypothetical protein [Paenirhodobacter sp.]|uniref:hypothetical protein n=1 Tax=Paenirhodobacter sp. TaxID=1965326 RepID=UPI003B3C8B86